MHKKVTLSLNSIVYHNFQRFCNERAIMLSRKIEIMLKLLIDKPLRLNPSHSSKHSKFGKPQKVTLSIDPKVYSQFQKYCDENAIMLSKKIEMIMDEIMEAER